MRHEKQQKEYVYTNKYISVRLCVAKVEKKENKIKTITPVMK